MHCLYVDMYLNFFSVRNREKKSHSVTREINLSHETGVQNAMEHIPSDLSKAVDKRELWAPQN